MDRLGNLYQQVRRPDDWRKPQNEVNSRSGPDPAYCLRKAQMLLGLFRKDEANNPEIYAAGIAAILQDYPQSVVERATDPRTGIATRCKFGLPNPADVKEFCDDEMARQYRMAQEPIYRSSEPIRPPAPKPGQYTYAEFLEMAGRGEVKSRPIGRFEKDGSPQA